MDLIPSIFFMGKGGVGKSTSAALSAVQLTRQGKRVLLVSMDPAHNQSDIFQTRLGEHPKAVAEGLTVIEIDLASWVRRYLKSVQQQIRQTYTYLTAFNLEGYFDVMKYAPGLEEHALVLAYRHLRKTWSKRMDCLVCDMPPTALSLRFFSLPQLSLIWIDQLKTLREKIIAKRELITKIRLGRAEIERDKVLGRINEQASDYRHLKACFEDPQQTHIHMVLNPDLLSSAESLRIRESLKSAGISLKRIICNKAAPGTVNPSLEKGLDDIPLVSLPLADRPLIGLPALTEYLDADQRSVARRLDGCGIDG